MLQAKVVRLDIHLLFLHDQDYEQVVVLKALSKRFKSDGVQKIVHKQNLIVSLPCLVVYKGFTFYLMVLS